VTSKFKNAALEAISGSVTQRWFGFTLVLALALCLAGADSRLRLKAPAGQPAAGQYAAGQYEGLPRRRPYTRPHMLVEFSRTPSLEDIRELNRRGATVVSYVPDRGVVVAAGDTSAFDGMDLVRARLLRPQEKLSARLTASSRSFVVEFHGDVDASTARSIVSDAGLTARENPDLLANDVLAEGTPEAAARAAEWDEVAYIYPASADLLANRRVAACPGAITLYGPVGQYIDTVGDGWAGPGHGAANVGYFFGQGPSRLPAAQAQAEILRALGEWAKYVQVTFSPAASASAEHTIAILFAARSHGDPYPFDGPGHVLAHTFFPSPPNPEPIAGDMHFDDDESWAVGADVDVFSVALHELGHALGLGHSDQPGSVMYPYYSRATALTSEDIDAIRRLYAARTDTAPADPPKPPETPAEPPVTPSQPPATPAAVKVAITSPTPGVSATASITLAGTADCADGIARVMWSNSRGGGGQAAGTKTWLAGPIVLVEGANVLTATAYSATGASASASVAVTYSASADTAAPTIVITSPAGTSVLTYQASIVIQGTASDPSGIAEVRWSDSIGTTGPAQGTNFWTTSAIPLREGTNTITIHARDGAGNTAWRSLMVTRKK
jgi:hypothetical protein